MTFNLGQLLEVWFMAKVLSCVKQLDPPENIKFRVATKFNDKTSNIVFRLNESPDHRPPLAHPWPTNLPQERKRLNIFMTVQAESIVLGNFSHKIRIKSLCNCQKPSIVRSD